MEETASPCGEKSSGRSRQPPREPGNPLKGSTSVPMFEAKLGQKEHGKGDEEKLHQFFKHDGEGVCGCFISTHSET